MLSQSLCGCFLLPHPWDWSSHRGESAWGRKKKKKIYLIFVVFLVTASITVGGLFFFKDCFKHNLINLSIPLVIVVKVGHAEIVTATNKPKSFCGFLLNIFHINE